MGQINCSMDISNNWRDSLIAAIVLNVAIIFENTEMIHDMYFRYCLHYVLNLMKYCYTRMVEICSPKPMVQLLAIKICSKLSHYFIITYLQQPIYFFIESLPQKAKIAIRTLWIYYKFYYRNN